MIARRLSLLDFFENHYLLNVSISESTAYQYGRSIQDFETFHGRHILVAKLNSDVVNRWILGRTGQLSPVTLRNRRAAIMAIWRHAAECDLVADPVRVRRVQVPRKIPVAWTPGELSQLLRCCDMMGPYREYFRCLLSVGYETGLRRSDLLAVHWEMFNDDGVAVVIQHKTQMGHVIRVRPETLDELRRVGSLQWTLSIRTLYYQLRKLCNLAQVRRGTLQQLRRSGATAVELAAPGCAQRYLGHSNPALAGRYYIDWSQVQMPVQPPAIRQF